MYTFPNICFVGEIKELKLETETIIYTDSLDIHVHKAIIIMTVLGGSINTDRILYNTHLYKIDTLKSSLVII